MRRKSHTGALPFFNEIVRSQSWVPTVGVGMKARLCAPTGMPQLLTMSATSPGSNRSTSFATRDVIRAEASIDRKSTRLNSSHSQISYAVFCLKKKKNTTQYAAHYNL